MLHTYPIGRSYDDLLADIARRIQLTPTGYKEAVGHFDAVSRYLDEHESGCPDYAIQALGDLEVEPNWWGDSRRPDAATDAFVIGRTTAIEIAATTDDAISGEEDMGAIAVQISEVASRARKGVGDHLYFRYREESGYLDGRYIRRRLAPRGYKLIDDQRAMIEDGSVRESVGRSA